MEERQRKDDVGAQKMNERLKWGIDMMKEISKEHGFEFTEAIFIEGAKAGVSMFIQSEKR